MPPKSKRARQNLEAAAKGREVLKLARLEADTRETEPEPQLHHHAQVSLQKPL